MWDGRKFLELKLNSGSTYSGEIINDSYCYELDCGCIKGNFNLLFTGSRGRFTNVSPRAFTILSVGERMLFQGFPEKAKWFVFNQMSKLDDISGDIPNFSAMSGGFYTKGLVSLVDKVKTRLKGTVNV